MRQPSGFWETAFYYIGLVLFHDLERTAVFLGAVGLLGTGVASFRSDPARREWIMYTLAGLCMALVALLHVVHSRLLAGAVLALASVLLGVGIAERRRELRSSKAQ